MELPKNTDNYPQSEKLYPGRESSHLNDTVDKLEERQKSFIAECTQREMSVEETSAAIHGAMRSGAYPKVLWVRERRNPSREIYLFHGEIPDGVVRVKDDFGKLTFGLEKPPGRGSGDWPTEPDLQNPDTFYVEHHHIDTADSIPTWGDDRDKQLALEYRELNGQLSSMLASSEDV